MNKVLFFSLLLLSTALNAQKLAYKKYDWKAAQKAPESDTSQNAVILEDYKAMEFFYNPEKKNNLDMVRTYHRRVQVNTEKGIEQYNRISFYYNPDEVILTIKARTTDKNGKVTEFSKSNLREVDSEEGRMLNFPIDGVKKGDVIEYLYQVNESPSYWDRVFIQYEYPVQHSRFELISPENLKYDAKIYNGTMTRTDTSYDERNFTTIWADNVMPVREEKYMYVQPNRMRIDMKLAFNSARGNARLFTWTDAAQRVFEGHYTYTKGESSAIRKFVKGLKMPEGMTTDQQIRWLELRIKNDIAVQMGAYTDLAEVIKNKVASPKGINRLFSAVFLELGIEHELVLTSPRNKIRFDKEFDHWSVLDEYMIYFPSTKKLMAPDELGYRYPYVNAYLTGTDGLFISQVKLGDVLTGLGKVKYIQPFTAEQNTDVLYVKMKINPDKEEAILDIDHGLGGLSGAGFVPYLGLMKPADADEICERILKSDIADARLKMKPYRKEMTVAGLDERFHLQGVVTTNELVEVAGEKLLFNIGQSIGRQTELYQEFDRVHPVENSWNRKYIRELTLEIPEGYVLQNPDALNFDVKHTRDGKLLSVFASRYELQGNQLKVIIDEYYTEIYMPVSEFEQFKAVINAAADFQKVKLVFEKKK